jgi:hypothetical protein
MRITIHPARYRIGAKGQNQRGNCMVDFGVADDGRDPRWLDIHGDVPVWQWSAKISEWEISAYRR